MRYLHLVFISIFLLAVNNTSTAQTPQTTESAQLVESRELTSKVIQLYGERKYDDALPLAKRALELAESALGKTHSRLVPLLINLGGLYLATLDFDDAKACFERALNIGEQSFGANDLRLTRPLDELGYLASNKREYRKAADFFYRSLVIKEKFLESGNVEIPRAAFTLGDIYRKSREFTKAETFYQQAIRLYEKSGSKHDAELVEVLRRYLNVLTAQNKKDEITILQARIADLSAEPGFVEGGVVNGLAVKLVQPPYPPVARAAHASGQVHVQVLIGENGNVISAHAVRGHPLLQGAGVAAAKASKFTPTLKSGVAVKVRGTIIYNFIDY